MKRGKRSTANKESDVNALAGVKFPPSNVNIPKDITVTKTGMLFSMNPLHCKQKKSNKMLRIIILTKSIKYIFITKDIKQ